MGAFHTCGPNEALIVSGVGLAKPTLVPGGRIFAWTGLQKVQRISLNVMAIEVASSCIYTKYGVPVNVTGVAQVKIEGSNTNMLHTACRQFLGKRVDHIVKLLHETLEGHQRAIIGAMSVEEIILERKKFSDAVFEHCSKDLVNMGCTVVSYTIREITDDKNYLSNLGVKKTSEAKRNATIGEAEADMESGIKQSIAEYNKLKAKYENDIEIARSQRDFSLKNAEFNREIQARKVESDLSYQLQTAVTNQTVMAEQVGVLIAERKKEINVQDQEIRFREKELEATVRGPALAEKYRIEMMAEAEKKKRILEAQAEAEAIKARGEAEAFSINAKAQAEAEAMNKRAEAWKEYNGAALVDMMLGALPNLASEIAAPLTNVSKITMVSGGDGEIGVSKLTGELLELMTRIPQVVNQLTGVDMAKTIERASSVSKK